MSPNIKHFTFASKAVNSNHFRNHQHNNKILKTSSKVHMKDFLEWLKQLHKNIKAHNATTVETRESGAWRDSRLNRRSTISCTLLGNMPKTNKPKEGTTRTRVCVCVCVCIFHAASKRNNYTYTCHVSLFSSLMQCDLLKDNSRNGPAKFNSIIFNENHL